MRRTDPFKILKKYRTISKNCIKFLDEFINNENFYKEQIQSNWFGVQYGDNGENKYFFQTRANHSSAKTPLGMFKDFEIPNSLKLVDDTIRKYYKDFELFYPKWSYSMGNGETRIGKNRTEAGITLSLIHI